MEIAKDDRILKYIPQRFPFVMVDTLYSVNEKTVISGFTVKDDNILLQNNRFPEGGLIENMAQTAALYAGYQASALGKEAPIGYIGAIKDLHVKGLPVVGDVLQTKVAITNEVMNVQIAQASVYNMEEILLASCELRIFIKEEG